MGSAEWLLVGFTIAFVAVFAFGVGCGWLMRRPVPPSAAPPTRNGDGTSDEPDDRLWKSWGTQVAIPTLILAAIAALWLWLQCQGWFAQAPRK
jgi:sterol desaturase/sphingolipid hydroxylase (fatty acid hydroxylase superfamily)